MHFTSGLFTSALMASSVYAAQQQQAMVSVKVVQVGSMSNALTIQPNNVQAAVGDMVQFQFLPRNHSLAQAAFGSPCQPINQVRSNTTGFWSGFMANSGNQGQMPTFTIQITTTEPIYFYSATFNECQGGMVGAINAPQSGSQTVQAFAAAAKRAQNNIVPSAQAASNSSATSTGSPGASSTSASSAAPPQTLVGVARQALVGTLLTGAAVVFLL